MRAANVLFCTIFGLAALAAQDPAPDHSSPLYRVTVVSPTTKAINYGHLTGPTKVGLKGTVLMQEAQGEARVESRRGAMEIEERVNHLTA